MVAVDLGPARADEALAVRVVGHQEAVELDPVRRQALAQLVQASTRPVRGGRRRRGCWSRARPLRRGRARRDGWPAGRVAATTSGGSGRATRIWSRSRSGTKPLAWARSSSAGPACMAQRCTGRAGGASASGTPDERGDEGLAVAACAGVDDDVEHGRPVLAAGRGGRCPTRSPRGGQRRAHARPGGGPGAVTARSCGSGRGGASSAAAARANRQCEASSRAQLVEVGRSATASVASTAGQRNPVP